jgi:peptidoglycan-associated lipoprotein
MWFIVLSLVACKRNPEAVQPLGATGGPLDPAALAAASATGASGLPAEVAQALAANFARVHFPTDSASLDAEGRQALSANAALLRQYRDVRVEVQGHADERGTVDYNLALGQRRGRAVVEALVADGVAPSRLLLVSFGEERPLSQGSGEVAWAENRRAEFRLLTSVQGLRGTTL